MSSDSMDETRVRIDVTDTTDTEVDDDYKRKRQYMGRHRLLSVDLSCIHKIWILVYFVCNFIEIAALGCGLSLLQSSQCMCVGVCVFVCVRVSVSH